MVGVGGGAGSVKEIFNIYMFECVWFWVGENEKGEIEREGRGKK